MASEIVHSDQPSTPSVIMPRPEIDLYILGGVREGKSATANSILGREEFQVDGDDTEPIKLFQRASTSIDGRQINVMEVSSERDPNAPVNEHIFDPLVVSMMKALYKFPHGFGALVFVISYAEKLSHTHLQTVQQLKLLLGEDVIRKFTICVFTHADEIKKEMEIAEVDFITWCQLQDDDIVESLFKECCFRCVLFDNLTEDENEKKSQILELISKVDYLMEKQTRYTFDKFQHVRKTTNNQGIVDSFWREMDEIRYDMEKIAQCPYVDATEKLKRMKETITLAKKDLDGLDENDSTVLLSYLEALSINMSSLEWTFNEVDGAMREGETVRERTMHLEESMGEEIEHIMKFEKSELNRLMIKELKDIDTTTAIDGKLETLELQAQGLSETIQGLWQTINHELGDGNEHDVAIRENFIKQWQRIKPTMEKMAKDEDDVTNFIEIVEPLLKLKNALAEQESNNVLENTSIKEMAKNEEDVREVIENSEPQPKAPNSSTEQESNKTLHNILGNTSPATDEVQILPKIETVNQDSPREIMHNVKISLILVLTSIVVGAGNTAYKLFFG